MCGRCGADLSDLMPWTRHRCWVKTRARPIASVTILIPEPPRDPVIVRTGSKTGTITYRDQHGKAHTIRIYGADPVKS